MRQTTGASGATVGLMLSSEHHERNDSALNVLHVVGTLGVGGDTSVILSVMPQLEKAGVKFGFITLEGCNPKVVQQLRDKGAEVVILPGDVRKLGVVAYYRQMRSTFSELKTRYDTVHIHTALQSGISLAAAAHAGFGNRICHAHTINILRDTGFLKKVLVSPFLRLLINHYSTKRVACGTCAGMFLYGRKKKFDVLYNGVDVSAYTQLTEADTRNVKTALGIEDSRIVVGHVGRFTDVKNQAFILKLAEMTDETYAFVLVGDGENYEKIKKEAEMLQKPIVFTGRRSDIPELMHAFDCLLLPSLSEGLPLALVEAQAAGCPCLASIKVPAEADLGLGLVQYIGLDEIDRWRQCIEAITGHAGFAKRSQYAERVREFGFDAAHTYAKWLGIYQVRSADGGANAADAL